jgi:hypothetical protein
MEKDCRSLRSWVALLFAAAAIGCADDTAKPPLVDDIPDYVFVTTTDYVTGSASVIALDSARTTVNNVAAVHSDPVARYFDGLIYVVNRFGGDNIQVLNPSNGFATVRQFSVGNGSDPHDIAVVSSTKAYVTRYNDTQIWIVNPMSGTKTGEIDLAMLADADGLPEMDYMTIVGDRLFVTVQRVDRNTLGWPPTGVSYMVIVDIGTNALYDLDPFTPGVQPITLAATNPFSAIEVNPVSGKLCVAGVGNWGVADGGVAVVDPVTLESEGVMFAEDSVSGDITDVAIVSGDRGYVIYNDASFNTVLAAFNPQTGANLGTVYAPGGFVLRDAEVSPFGEVFLTDRTPTNPGIRIYDAATGSEITVDPIDVGLPPFDITFGGRGF